ncbi:hypothetical protein pb186bvf_015332 [Paramecium bursaria]
MISEAYDTRKFYRYMFMITNNILLYFYNCCVITKINYNLKYLEGKILFENNFMYNFAFVFFDFPQVQINLRLFLLEFVKYMDLQQNFSILNQSKESINVVILSLTIIFNYLN